MQVSNEVLVNDLTKRVNECLTYINSLEGIHEKKLVNHPKPNAWNVIECLEHLNLYGEFYIPEIKKAIEQNNQKVDSKKIFKTGWLGNYFAKSLLPKENLNTMKTFKDKDPYGQKLEISTVIQKFVQQQKKILSLLRQAENLNLTKIKTGISISKFIKLRLGDTFRVVIYHNQRHIEQIKKNLSQVS